MRRILLAALAASLLPLAASAQERTMRIVSGFAPGGTADLVSRLIAEAAGPHLGARVVVENRTGANGFIAAEMVARSPADGSVLLQCPMGTMTISPELPGAVLPVDPRTELVPVVNIALSSYGAVVGARSPYRSVQDVLAAARARPGTVSYASAGVGSAQHLTGARLAAMAGLDLVHVPYRGAAPAVVDLIAGRTDLLITNLGDVVRQIQGGELRLLALADAEGVPEFAAAPRLSEAVPGLEVAGWFGLCGPRGLAPEAIRRWSSAVEAALRDPTVRQRLLENGLTPSFEGPERFAARMQRDRQAWGDTIRRANIQAQ
ncbi:Bug family tripartite tricarboxylate transporter substrate binding protein [Sabulicella glaciei]|uniref:Tripartite tricarboxylate transporter substrate binding protein n=1 Tax=Sabulicella glaciei TaxID=2984948 RepID=A0ABT3NU39_9PROT|nr:tripartite tricarboxylate transporter substrate binding protein [Roseococcus sp. MDT2-1-1]MCW8085668.1 tripartite tricarboxylate transporter substrate binding protein [Roseococcus sp. MDT2-1-1]